MYEVDDRDEVVCLDGVPEPDAGAPLPAVVADEGHLLLAYLVGEPDPGWDGSYVNVVSPDSEGLATALVEFRRPYAHLFGPPNDEAFAGHPLAGRGLRPYAAFEILHSSWLRRLERMNAVHPRHDPEQFLASRRHFVFAFHDSTFECIAQGYMVHQARGSMRMAVRRMVELLSDKR